MPPRSADGVRAPSRVAGNLLCPLGPSLLLFCESLQGPFAGPREPSLPSRAYLYKIVKEVKNILQKI